MSQLVGAGVTFWVLYIRTLAPYMYGTPKWWPLIVLCLGAFSDVITSLKSGIRLTFTSATSPWAISRLVASPDAETPSQTVPPPCRIRVTISSEVSANLTLIVQPVWFWKGVTQSTLGSDLPLSTYPVQAIRLSLPSPAPMLCGRLLAGVLVAAPPPQAARITINPAKTGSPKGRFIVFP